MSFTLQKLADAPAILLTLSSGYNLFVDFPKSYAAVYEMLDSVDEPVYYILDLSALSLDMNLIMQGASSTSRGSQASFHHPKVKAVLMVSPAEVIHVAAEGLRTEIYGNVEAKTFYSLEDALAYARSNP
jgi:hypothetical protein